MIAALCPAVWGKTDVPLPSISMGDPWSITGSRRGGFSSGFPQVETAMGMGTEFSWEQGKARFKQQHFGEMSRVLRKGAHTPGIKLHLKRL